jgi:hypothetical protein
MRTFALLDPRQELFAALFLGFGGVLLESFGELCRCLQQRGKCLVDHFGVGHRNYGKNTESTELTVHRKI